MKRFEFTSELTERILSMHLRTSNMLDAVKKERTKIAGIAMLKHAPAEREKRIQRTAK
jgi:hypothetical protein